VSQRQHTVELSIAAAQLAGTRLAPRTVDFRLPTGADQEALTTLTRLGPARAADHLLARCVRRIGPLAEVDPDIISRLPACAREEIEAAIESRAPQVDVELDTICPVCRAPTSARFDVVSLLFDEARAGQHVLDREVHLLASHYHWSEHDICTMTRAKRRRYLTLLHEARGGEPAW
jgi:hypothetical protein